MSGVPFAFGATSPHTLRALRVLDVAAWVLIVVCGVLVATGHSISVEYVLAQHRFLVDAFATFWIVGGLAGLITRLLGLGIAEVPAITLTLTALVIYEVLWTWAVGHGFPLGLMPFVVGFAICALAGRWVVLHDLGRRIPRRRARDRRR